MFAIFSTTMPCNQRTISKSVSAKGIALHSGVETEIKFLPAQENSGIVFIRKDAKGCRAIPALSDFVFDASRGTSLKKGDAEARVVEHVLAAAAGLEIDNLKIELFGPEPPALDGSSLPYIALLKQAGVHQQKAEKKIFTLEKEVVIKDGDKELIASPFDRFMISFVVNFPSNFIGEQALDLEISPDVFEKEIAPARTFGFIEEVEKLKAAGLAKGASEENALVASRQGYINKPRFSNEIVRHKILDLIGDLALLGMPIKARIAAKKTGHRHNIELVKRLRMGAKNERE